MTNDDRIIVLVCSNPKCRKLIGTRENYHLVINPKTKSYMILCEGCYDNK